MHVHSSPAVATPFPLSLLHTSLPIVVSASVLAGYWYLCRLQYDGSRRADQRLTLRPRHNPSRVFVGRLVPLAVEVCSAVIFLRTRRWVPVPLLVDPPFVVQGLSVPVILNFALLLLLEGTELGFTAFKLPGMEETPDQPAGGFASYRFELRLCLNP
jgi:hypothetical protein